VDDDQAETAKQIIARGSKTSGTRVKRPKTKHKQRQIEQRAQWVVREWNRSPTYKYAEMIDAICERFQIGESQAGIAYARANEILSEASVTLDANQLLEQGLELFEVARHEGDLRTAYLLWNAITVNFGYAAPRKHDVSVGGAITVHQMAHLNVIAMTPTQREQRARELETKAHALAAADDGDVTGLAVMTRPADPASLQDIVEAAVIDVVAEDIAAEDDAAADIDDEDE